MKKIIIPLAIVLMTMACTQSTPECIEEKIETFKQQNAKTQYTSITTFEEGGKTYHVFDHGIAFDGTAKIMDESCTTVCVYGGNRQGPREDCHTKFKNLSTAKTLWEGGK